MELSFKERNFSRINLSCDDSKEPRREGRSCSIEVTAAVSISWRVACVFGVMAAAAVSSSMSSVMISG